MKRRMEQLINGRFEYEVPKLVLSDQNITVHTKTGENYRGELFISAEDDRRFKGMAMSSNRRILLAKEKFSGTTVCIPYGVEVKGLRAGDTVDGNIVINSSLGEYLIPVHVDVEEEQICTSMGELRTLDEFVKLAGEDDREAFRLYTSDNFYRLLQGEDEKYKTIYRGLSQNPVTYQHMEEFLIAAGRKEPVEIRLEEPERNLGNIQYTTKESFQIVKNTWGYVRVELDKVGDFISLEKTVLTQDDFIGSVCNVEYLIRKDQLGKGKQYGKIIIRTVYGEQSYGITVSGEDPYDISTELIEKNSMITLTRVYEKYRLGDVTMEEWEETSRGELDKLKNLGCYLPKHQLMDAYMAYRLGNEEEAKVLLNELDAAEFTQEQMEEEGAYLGMKLTLDMIPEEEKEEVGERLGTLFRMNPGSRILMEVLFATQAEYQTSYGKQIFFMEQIFEMGCCSPFLYLDAYEILQKEESNLRKLTPFMIHVLAYAAKHDKLTEELILRIGHLSEYEKTFQPVLYRILEKSYEKVPHKDLISNICKYIMKGHPGKKEYFKWYSRAVEQDIRITGLYEYYISTMPSGYQSVLPQVIRMYFVYNNTLSSKKRAAVYANVIRNKNKDRVTYQNYKKNMEEFAWKSMEKGKISEDYAVIYQECINNLKDDESGRRMAELMFTQRLYCDDPKVRNVIVCHKELSREESFPCSDGVAYIRLYTDDAKIFFEDDKKRRYAVTVDYNLQKIMDESLYQEQCMGLGVQFPGLLLSVCGKEDSLGDITIDNLEGYQHVAQMEEFQEEYRHKICAKILEYYAGHVEDDTLDAYLRKMDYLTFAQVDKVRLIQLLIEKGMYERAFSVISQYGYEGVAPDKLMKMTSRTIVRTEFVENEELVYLALYVFEQGIYDDVILLYLSDNLLGPVEQMQTLWERMRGFSLDTYTLEEEILLLAMFGRVTLKQGYKILRSYIRQKGKQQVILAYLSFSAYEYFLGDHSMDEFIVTCLEICYEKQWDVDRICRLALLKYYSEKEVLSKKQLKITAELLERCSESGLRFGFFRTLPDCCTKPYQLDDKQFIEEHFSPGSKVTIHYSLVKNMDDTPEYKSEPVKDMYQGIFVKEFLLFYGEILRYYLTVENGDNVQVTEEKTLTLEDTFREGETRYQLLNQIISSKMLEKDLQMEKSMMDYLKKECMVKELFSLIR